jgi:hypothetical protein
MIKRPSSLLEDKNLAICRLEDKCDFRDKLGFCKMTVSKCNQKAELLAELDMEIGEDDLLTVVWLNPAERKMFALQQW